MNIILYVPGMPFNGATIASGKSLGGSESAGYYLARELASRGHGVTVFSNIPPEEQGTWDQVRYLPIGPANQQAPFGAWFMDYAQNVPSEVIVAQRVPNIFSARYNSKLNFWWTHDLALKRSTGAVSAQLWNVDRVFTVSAWHKQQVEQVYGIDSERVGVLRNGVDGELFKSKCSPDNKKDSKALIYSSRPERGLVNLVGGDGRSGIMELLQNSDPEIVLKVAGYDNTSPEMAGMYQALRQRCETLPNVEWMGPLSKRELADLMKSAWLHIYPTTFEEVSCITVMEQQWAGTPVLASKAGALPETLKGAGADWVSNKDNTVDRQRFADRVLHLQDKPSEWDALHVKALKKAPSYTWANGADAIEKSARECFAENTDNADRVRRHLVYMSDIFAAKELGEVPEAYDFAFNGPDALSAHYVMCDAWNVEQGNSHQMGSPVLEQMPRFVPVANEIASLPAGVRVLDYGCAEGQFTENLARRNPDKIFVGLDFVKTSIDAGRNFLAEHPLDNLKLLCGVLDPFHEKLADALVLMEVVEHQPDPGAFVAEVEKLVKPGGKVIFTVPAGAWEAKSYNTWPFRQHLHHLEPRDLRELFGDRPGYRIDYIPVPERGMHDEALGNHMVVFEAQPGGPLGKRDMVRKLSHQSPRQTLSACMIVRTDGDTLARCLRTIKEIADEIIIGIDGPEGEGRAREIAESFGAKTFNIESPLKTGFSAARNSTLEKATCDWILWIDDDEQFQWPERVHKYLRANQYDAYAVKQHHYAIEPEGLIKTDVPCRIFRRNHDVQFYGLVHEHPEKKINEGIGRVFLLPDVAICHNGYETEDIRRRRFERNLPLMIRERGQEPRRILANFLWIRDLIHLIRYAMERGERNTPKVSGYAEEAVSLWRELVKGGHCRMAVDSIEYYSQAVQVLHGGGIEVAFALGLKFMNMGNMNGGPPPEVRGIFANRADVDLLTGALMEESLSVTEGDYL